jgi:formylglycine-generating enzyme required for sulfatase activity
MGRDNGFDVFLSYARSDVAAAAELEGWLRSHGLRTFFDRSELRAGLRWIPALEDAIGRSNAVAILVGEHGIGNTQQYERELALVRQTRDNSFPVIPVLMPGCENPPTGFLQLLTWIDLSRADSVLRQTDSLEALRRAIHRQEVLPSSIRTRICPYRGLEPFREEDAAFFCGRDDAIRNLVSQVQRYPLVAVVGPSGGGKSSLVFAGLLPALRQQRETTMWDVVTFRPGASPLRALAAAFGTAPENAGPAATDTYLENEAAAYRAGDHGKLGRIVNDRLDAAPEKPDRLLIYVDQWEELYAMAPATEHTEQRRQHSSDVEKFIALLVEAASGQDSRTTLVLTIRADFYNPLIRHALLSTLLPRQQVNIPPMSLSDLRSAIERPAMKAGLSFAPPALVDQILNDVGTEDGRLPLLQFALKETWERREGDRLTAEAYMEVGGVTGAIQKTAERAYASLTAMQQEAARRLFLRLVTPGEGQTDTRARSAIPDDPQQRAIINLFSNPRTRLLVTGYDTLQGPAPLAERNLRATVEVAHEALIRRWSTLRAWVDGNREKLRARAAILRAKAEWEENGCIDKFLLDPGIQLERGRSLLEGPGDVAVDDIRDYVERSIKKEERRLAAEREAALAMQRRALRVRLLVGALAFVIVASLIGWLNQDYLREQVRQFVIVRPYMHRQVRPHVLTATQERALKPGDHLKECARDCPEMVVIPAGEFVMGSAPNEVGRDDDEGPPHTVVLVKPFAVSRFEVTFDEWDACVDEGDCDPRVSDNGWGRGLRPVMNVTWNDAQRYVAWFSKVTGKFYRLLSEAEWEYAARAGTHTAYSWGDEIGKGNAHCDDCSSPRDAGQTAPVGSFAANVFGIHDMHGNVWEWVEDCYHRNYSGAPTDGSAWTSGDCNSRVARGGSWNDEAGYSRSARRYKVSTGYRNLDTGFRVGRTLNP